MKPSDRRKQIEKALKREPWSINLAKRLAAQIGCSLTTIRNDHRAMKAGKPASPGTAADQNRDTWLANVQQAREKAVIAEAWTAASSLLKLEGSAMGVDQPPAGELEALPDLDDHERELMACVRTMRRRAMDRGSFVAAGKLLEQEQKYVEAERAKRKAARDAAMAGVPDAELVQKLVTTVESLPLVQRRAVVQALGHLSQVH